MRSFVFRPLLASEVELLETATLQNMNWCADRFTITEVRENPVFAHYTELVPARGDFGLVAVVDDRPVGVAWAMFLPATDPGYGFLDEETPEISLWVDASVRGGGIGRTLLRDLIAEGARRGIKQMSLSVEAGNYAKSLYLSEGFTDVAADEADGVMVCRF